MLPCFWLFSSLFFFASSFLFSLSLSLPHKRSPSLSGIHLARLAGEKQVLKEKKESANGKKALGLFAKSVLSLLHPPPPNSLSLSSLFSPFFLFLRRRGQLPGEVVDLRAAPLELLAHRLHPLCRVQRSSRSGGSRTGGGFLGGGRRALATVIAASVGDGGLCVLFYVAIRE